MTLRIGNAAGFLGDQLDAPCRLVESAELDYLTLEYLAELTMSILARLRQKDPAAGYAGDFLRVLGSLSAALEAQPGLKIVTNAGGVNPPACAIAAGKLLAEAGLGEVRIAVVTGDDLLPRLDALQRAGWAGSHLDSGEPLSGVPAPIVAANAYLGAGPIVEALEQEARVVITGRVADASLTVGPAVARFGWDWDDLVRLAGATVAGHLIECGAQVTGGYSTRWEGLRLEEVGYPIAEIDADGGCVITKPEGSGGIVDRISVTEQLLYEIGDPSGYLTPDVTADFSTVEVAELAKDRVQVSGASGKAAPDAYKVSLAYQDGFATSAQLVVAGRDCVKRAEACAEMVLERVRRAGFSLGRTYVELLGRGDAALAGGVTEDPPEVVLRVSAHDARREAVERLTREMAPLITSGPAGLAGYASGRSAVRAVYAYWPTLVPKELVEASVECRSASEWGL